MRLLSAALLSAFAVCVYGFFDQSRCPPSEDMPRGCACRVFKFREISVRCVGAGEDKPSIEEIATTLKEKFPAKTTEIDFLYLLGFNDTLSSRTFDGLRIGELNIIKSHFERWADEVGGPAFVGLEDSLQVLQIWSSIFLADEYNGETEMPAPFSLGHLRELAKVKIFKNRLYVFGNDWFGEGGSSVDELDIEQNEIHVIGQEAFAGLTNMRNFKAERNSITQLTRSMFPEESLLTLLDVRRNKLEGFPEDFFVNFPYLSKIELNENPIKYIPENVFGKIWLQLRYIDFKNTRLHCDDHINWMMDLKEPFNLYGWCYTPEEVAGDTLRRVLHLRRENRDREE